MSVLRFLSSPVYGGGAERSEAEGAPSVTRFARATSPASQGRIGRNP